MPRQSTCTLSPISMNIGTSNAVVVTREVVCNVTTVQLQTLDITLGKRWSFHKRYYVRTMPSCTEAWYVGIFQIARWTCAHCWARFGLHALHRRPLTMTWVYSVLCGSRGVLLWACPVSGGGCVHMQSDQLVANPRAWRGMATLWNNCSYGALCTVQ